MSLFKIFKGDSSRLKDQPIHDGYCWFTADDGKFYIDTDNERLLINPDPGNGPKGETGPQGVSISKIEQTTTSTEDDGTNTITITLSNGTTSTFDIKNGSKGSTGSTGAAGKDGTTPTIKAAAGSNINTVGTPTVTASTSGTTTTFTFNNLKGATGAKGKSAYEVAKANGYTGTEAQWVASLGTVKTSAAEDFTEALDDVDLFNGVLEKAQEIVANLKLDNSSNFMYNDIEISVGSFNSKNTATINIPDIRETDKAIIYWSNSTSELGIVSKSETIDGGIKVYCTEKPSIDLFIDLILIKKG